MRRRRSTWSSALSLSLWLGLATVGLVGLATPGSVAAQSADQRIEQMIEKAETQYGNLELKAAERTLEDAIQASQSADVSSSVVARAHVMMGVIRYGATRSKDKARSSFQKAIERDRDASLPSAYKTPTLSSLMEELKADLPEQQPSTSSSDDQGSSRQVDAFTHEPITSAQAGESLRVEAFAPADMPVADVYMFFKRYDQSTYKQQAELEPADATRFTAEIDGNRIYTSQISYYLEAVDRTGDVIARSGTSSDPHSMTVLGASDFDPDKAASAKGSDGEQGGTPQTPPPDDRRDDEPASSGGRDVAYLGLAAGTGVGFLPGGTPTANPTSTDRINPGLAPAFAHVLLDVGGMITPSSHLGIYARWQFSPTQNFDAIRQRHPDLADQYRGLTGGECLGTGLSGDCTLGIKYRWFFTQNSNVEAFSSIGAGVGRLRHWLRLRQREDSAFCQNNNKEIVQNPNGPAFCYRRDTVRPGWMHIGVGTGFVWHASDVVSLYGEGYLQILFPDTGLNLDFNVGPMFRF